MRCVFWKRAAVPICHKSRWLRGAALGQASCQFHALFRDFTHTLFAMPDIIPSTDKMEQEISDSSSDICDISVQQI